MLDSGMDNGPGRATPRRPPQAIGEPWAAGEPWASARHGTRSVKWDLLRNGDELPFTIADMDLPSPAGLAPVLGHTLGQSALGYTFEDPRVRSSVARWYRDIHGAEVAADCVLTAALSPKSVLRVVLRALGCSGRTVLFEPPVYSGFAHAIEHVGARSVPVPLKLRCGRYQRDLGAVEAAMRTAAPAALLLCSPQNPMGRVWERDELTELMELAARYAVPVVSDEVHGDLALDPGVPHIPALGADRSACTVVVTSPGKTFNVSAIPSSVVLSHDRNVLGAIRRELTRWGLHPGSLVTDAMISHLFDHERAWRAETVTRLRRLRDLLIEALEAVPGLTPVRPSAGFLAWIDARDATGGGSSAGQWFADRGVGVTDGTTFGPVGAGFVRWNFATADGLLREAARRLQKRAPV